MELLISGLHCIASSDLLYVVLGTIAISMTDSVLVHTCMNCTCEDACHSKFGISINIANNVLR